MTSRERIQAAMQMSVPDRVPLMCQLSIGHMLRQLGISPVEFWFDVETFAEGLVNLRSIYDFDGILVSLHGHDPRWKENIVSRQSTQEGELVTLRNGIQMMFPDDDLPYRVLSRNFSSATAGGSVRLADLPPVLDYIPVSQGVRFQIDPLHRFDIFRSIRGRIGQAFSLHGEVTSPFDYFLDFVGHENGLMMLIDEPAQSREALSHLADCVADLSEAMCREQVDAVKISSPFSGAGFISREFYQEFVLPYEARVVNAIRSNGGAAYMHVCGAIGDRLDLILDTGADGIECLDPPPLGDVELAEAKQRLAGRGFIKGNVDSVTTLLLGSKEMIIADLEHRVLVGKEGGGFILSSACSVAPHVPREHLLLLREAVERWG